MGKTRVFFDTNVILEANRISCWVSICNRYSVETVEKCIEEVLTGNPNDPNRVHVDRETLVNNLTARHLTNKKDILNLYSRDPDCSELDAGELHLFAFLESQRILPSDMILILTADKAAIEAIGRLGWLDSLDSLENLAQQSGVRQTTIKSLKQQYSNGWLEQIRTDIKLRGI